MLLSWSEDDGVPALVCSTAPLLLLPVSCLWAVIFVRPLLCSASICSYGYQPFVLWQRLAFWFSRALWLSPLFTLLAKLGLLLCLKARGCRVPMAMGVGLGKGAQAVSRTHQALLILHVNERGRFSHPPPCVPAMFSFIFAVPSLVLTKMCMLEAAFWGERWDRNYLNK